jgi:hypothetical protein
MPASWRRFVSFLAIVVLGLGAASVGVVGEARDGATGGQLVRCNGLYAAGCTDDGSGTCTANFNACLEGTNMFCSQGGKNQCLAAGCNAENKRFCQ